MERRIGSCIRKTKETDISLTINLDGQGCNKIDTGIPFFDHMLDGFARHGLFDLDVKVKGDIEVDSHHTIEDVGIVLGKAIADALGDKAGIKRYGYFILRTAVFKISGRLYRAQARDNGYGDGARVFLCRLIQRGYEPACKDPGRRE